MTFCHVEFNQLLADLALQPLSATERSIIEHITPRGSSITPQTANDEAALDRLGELGLAHEKPWGWIAAYGLEDIRDRGLLPQLMEQTR